MMPPRSLRPFRTDWSCRLHWSRFISFLLLLPLPVLADEAREADMFGGETPAALSDPTDPSDRSDPTAAPEEVPLLSDDRLAGRLSEADDILSLGGRLWLRLSQTVYREGNPADHSFAAPSQLDLFLDGRPNDRVRAFARGRLDADFTLRDGDRDMFGQSLEPLAARLDQLWLRFDIARTVYVTAGRQPLRWGTGWFWNPTDFVSRGVRDPLALFDTRLGVDIIKLHLPVESLGWNVYAVAELSGADSLDRIGAAGRAEFLFGPVELALSGGWRKDEPLRLGADLSFGLWYLDLRAEAAVSHGVRDPFWQGRLDIPTLTLPNAVSREDDWIPRLVAGVEASIPYGDDDSLIVGAEYFWNDAGYDGSNLYPWLFVNGGFTPLYLGRHYAGVYLLLMAPGRWDDGTVILSGMGNLSDRSFMARADVRVKVVTYLTVTAAVSGFFGSNGEFCYAFEQAGIPLPDLSGTIDVDIDAPAAAFELGASLEF